ncbi:unnamed protein product [Caenorhabditis nigoni]
MSQAPYTEKQLLDEPLDIPEAHVQAEGNPEAKLSPEEEKALEIAQQIKKHIDARRGDLVTFDMVNTILRVVGPKAYQEMMQYISDRGVPTEAETTLLRQYILQASEREARMRAQHKEHIQLFTEKIKELQEDVSQLRKNEAKLENQLKTGRVPKTKKCVLAQDEEEGCKICKQLDHPASSCYIYPTAEAKLSALKLRNACIVCTYSGHEEADCPVADRTPECTKCNFKHFRALCVERYGAAALERKKKEAEEQKEKQQAKMQAKMTATIMAGISQLAQPAPGKNKEKNKKRKLRKQKQMAKEKAAGKEE